MKLREIRLETTVEESFDISLLKPNSEEIYNAVVFVCENADIKKALLNALESNEANGEFLIVNSPEKDLHPKEQLKLYAQIKELNSKDQIFIFTNSENIIGAVLLDEDALILKVSFRGAERVVKDDFALPEITYGEIQYLAFDVISKEYHNQLYGRIAKLLEKHVLEWERAHHTDVEDLVAKYEKKPGEFNNPYGFIRNNHVEKLPTYIRNCIYYPENTDRKYTEEDLKKSIEILRNILVGSKQAWFHSYIGKID